MENNEIDSRWVDDHMAVLEPPVDWRPDSNSGLSRLHGRAGIGKGRRRRWIWSAATVSAACAVLLSLGAPQSCAWGACLLPTNMSLLRGPMVNQQAPYKVSGTPGAPITLEIYSDYECPYCARLYEETVPLLAAQYIQTGKAKLVHRDFPLPQHPYARVAARYANAAGELGFYDLAVQQIFRTRTAWAKDGNVGAQLAAVLPPGVMQKVRDKVQNDPRLDETVTSDLGMVGKDHINQTPTLVIQSKRGRQVIAPVPSFDVLKSYLDQLQQ
jgi:protein-disulfide isomerase